ncbi:MAG: PilN domain-containing protein [Myxococcaceae bacterium]
MMIRINLLPVRQGKKRELGKQWLVLGGVLVLGTLIGNALWYTSRASVASNKHQELKQRQQRNAELEKVIGEVTNINKRKKEVEDKLKVLGDLRKSRSGPVRMLDALAIATPRKVWVTRFEEVTKKADQGSSSTGRNPIKILGFGFTHEDVAEFMKGLSSIVWTPKGMARFIEQKRDSNMTRVELLAANGALEEFPSSEAGHFFSDVELEKAEQTEKKSASGPTAKMVSFEISLNASYAL